MSPRRSLLVLAVISSFAGVPAAAQDATHRIEETWRIAPLLEAGPAPVVPDAAALGCDGEPPSAGGFVRVGEDLGFQTLAGPLATRCRFHARVRALRPGWRVTRAVWRATRLRGESDRCRVRDLGVDAEAGTWRFEIQCAPAADAEETHGARAVLERIELLGPPGADWRDAFTAPPAVGADGEDPREASDGS